MNSNKINKLNIFNVNVNPKKKFLNIYIFSISYNTLTQEQQYIHKVIIKLLRYISFWNN